MKKIYNYRTYLSLSLISLLIGLVLSIFGGDRSIKIAALMAFSLFTIAVVMAAFEELLLSRPGMAKKIKFLFHIWRK